MRLFVWENPGYPVNVAIVIAPTVERARELMSAKTMMMNADRMFAGEPDIVRECDGPEYAVVSCRD